MVVLDTSSIDGDSLLDSLLLQSSSSTIPNQLHRSFHFHFGIQLHSGGNLHVLETGKRPYSSGHDSDGLYRADNLCLFCKHTCQQDLQTRYELNILSGLLTILFHLLVLLIPLLIVFNSKWIFIIVCLAIILLISIFLIYDTQVRIQSLKGIDDCQQSQVRPNL